MKKTYSTEVAAKRIGVSFRTINRWLAQGKIRPSIAIPLAMAANSGAGAMQTCRRPQSEGRAETRPESAERNESRHLCASLHH